MANFNLAYDITMGHEGGYANDPDDTGGETYAGVSRVNNPDWGGWMIIDKVKESGPTDLDKALRDRPALLQSVRALYQANYWDVNRLGQISNQTIANQLFDIGVNTGVGTASRVLQKALNLASGNGKYYADLIIDGKIGAKTLNALNNHPKLVNVFKLILGYQLRRYQEICEKNPKQRKFMNSWLSRIPITLEP
jgi:lysozyme family protein